MRWGPSFAARMKRGRNHPIRSTFGLSKSMGMQRLLVALVLIASAGCREGSPRSQFGEYSRHNKELRLASGDTFTVYRVKYWIFNDGSAPALQLEYEAPFPVSDTARLRVLAHRIWPAFAPYVEDLDLGAAVLTATNLRRSGSAFAWTARMQHFGLVAERDTAGIWRLRGDPRPLPPAEVGGPPRIFEPTGAPLSVAELSAQIDSLRRQYAR